MRRGITEVPGATGVRYRVRVETARDPDGRRHWNSATVATLAEAERQWALWTLAPGTAAGRMTLRQFLVDVWLPDYQERFAASSYRHRRLACETWLLPALGGERLESLGPRSIERALRAMRDAGCSRKRQVDVLGVLSAALNTAVRWGYLAQNPAARVRVEERRAVTAEPAAGAFTRDEVRRILAARDDVYGMLWKVLAGTALRLGEARGLRWTDLELERAVLHVRRTVARGDGGEYLGPPKSKAGRRDVLLPGWLVDELRAWRHGCQREALDGQRIMGPDAFVLAREDGAWLAEHAIYDRWRETLQAAHVEGAKVHQLRHTAISEQLMAGVALKTVAARAGHGTLRVTSDVYGHVLLEHQADAAQALEGLYAAPEEPIPLREDDHGAMR